MRRFTANDGLRWEAILGHESFGTFVILFTSAQDGAGSVRKSTLLAETAMGAEAEFDALGDDQLRELLINSSPW